MAVYHRSARPRFTLLMLILSATTLVTVDVKGASGAALENLRSHAQDAFAPVQALARDAISPIVGGFDGAFKYRHLADENARLRRQLDEASGAQVAAAGVQRENTDLKNILNLEFVAGLPSIAARVIAGPASNFRLSLVINRGSSTGVGKGMPVVSGAGLVGRIEAVSPNQATVLLVADPAFSVGIRVSPSGALAVASGQGAGRPLAVGLVGPEAGVEPGGAVVTSGLQQSPYPAGIPVGRVRSVHISPGALRQIVDVQPTVDAGGLTFVKVLVVSTP